MQKNNGIDVDWETYLIVWRMVCHFTPKKRIDTVSENNTTFTRKELYSQTDRQYSQESEAWYECKSTIWACAWQLEGMSQPITTRVRTGVVWDPNLDETLILNASFEFWKDNMWFPVDDIFQGGDSKSESIRHAELECMYRAESFLLGDSIDYIRIKYLDELAAEKTSMIETDFAPDDDTESIEAQEDTNVLTFKPRDRS